MAGHKVAKTKGSNVVVPHTPLRAPLSRCSTPFSPNEQKLQINLLLLLAILCSGWAWLAQATKNFAANKMKTIKSRHKSRPLQEKGEWLKGGLGSGGLKCCHFRNKAKIITTLQEATTKRTWREGNKRGSEGGEEEAAVHPF